MRQVEIIKYYKHGSILTPLWIYLDVKRLSKRGYILYSKDIVNDFDRGKACCMGCVFLPLALLGSKKKVKVVFKLKDVQ